jgi:hypothetical protein
MESNMKKPSITSYYRSCKADADRRTRYTCQGSASDKFRDAAGEGKESGEK